MLSLSASGNFSIILSKICFSVIKSKDDLLSSIIIRSGFLKNNRVKDILCCCPPEMVAPRFHSFISNRSIFSLFDILLRL